MAGNLSRQPFLITTHANQETRYQGPLYHLPYHAFKMKISRFDGTDPTGWIFKKNQFFEFSQDP